MAYRFKIAPRLFQPSSARLQFNGTTTTTRLARHLVLSRASMAPISTPPPGKHEWLVVIPDKPGTQQKRLEVRAQHFEGLKRYLEAGQFKTGGALLKDKTESDDPTKFDWYGSTIVIVAESKEEVKAILQKDIYTTAGVWDTENAQIWAAKIAFRDP
ncbi:hypothetical protein AAE478_006644 [Parahypoxylon ruwenzoriense]